MAKGIALRALELLFVLYFASHIPITVLFDSQAIFPASYYPEVIRDLVAEYAISFKDYLMANPTAHPWFMSFIYGECLLQFPFFFVAIYAFYKGSSKWIRIPGIIYAAHTVTTLQPILTDIYQYDSTEDSPPGPVTMKDKLTLMAVYLPYLLIPLLILIVLVFSKEYRPSVGPVVAAKPTGSAKSGAGTGNTRGRKQKPH